MQRISRTLLASCVLFLGGSLFAQTNSLTYLDEYSDAYYPGTDFPKLVTPQWVGEAGVDAVVTLAIDDMRDTAKYEAYLRPILNRLKSIDGRSPVSIMTCSVDPKDPQLQTWLAEGLSIEVHTVDHPCPCLQGNDFTKAKSTYDRCVDLMSTIDGNAPVAFRMPCCDSRNTPSPRFWHEIFNSRTANGNFLQADSSVFNVFTPADDELPRDIVRDEDGGLRFKKYIPFPSFVNTIENYPYPYVIGRLCWQFPCMVPSDWEAQNLHQPNNPRTVEDLKAALDATVIKRGIFNLVFHPHGWIRNDQVIELIDYAHAKFGKRVKFLTFKECVQRINQHLLLGEPLREPESGDDNGVRIADLNQDGYLDVIIGNERRRVARIWQTETNQWQNINSELQITAHGDAGRIDLGVRFGRISPAAAAVLVNNASDQSLYEVAGGKLSRKPLPKELQEVRTSIAGVDQGVRFRDLDGDGVCEIVVGNSRDRKTLKLDSSGTWTPQQEAIPLAIVNPEGRDNGLRFVDLDKDGHDDLIVSNGNEKAIRLYDSDSGGFTRVVEAETELPLIVRDGTNNGAWFAADHMWVQNEDTHRMPDLVDRRSFLQLIGNTEPGPRSPDLSLRSIEVRQGFTVELVAAEPMVMDPIAIDFSPDGKLWVVEMADYPLGMDDQGKPGGRVRYLEDTDGDGDYDKSTLFLDEIAYPTGVIAWRDGVIVSAAPTLFFAADRDGDGKAEVREELYRGFGEGNQQHRVNGFERGLDNWLYLANGDSGGTIESVKTGKQIDIRGRDLRIRPDDGSLDAQTGRTQFGRHRDDEGNWFGCSNPIPVRHFVLADHYLRRNPFVAPPSAHRDIARSDNTQLFPISRVLSHWSGYKPPAPGTAHRFTSACSTMVYRDDLFGDDFAGNTFTCEPVHNAVHRRRLVSSGVSFESVRPADESNVEFLASRDSWFRPATVTTGPDGAIWIVDMYRLVIEHPQWIDDQREQELFLRAGHDRGRIYRVYPTGRKPRKMPKLSQLSQAQLVEKLGSANGRTRDLVQRLLIEQDASSEPVRRVVRSSEKPLARLHALCTLDGLDAISVETLLVALQDKHPAVRRHAIRLSEPFLAQGGSASDELLTALADCDDRDPHVRFQLAYSLGASLDNRATQLLAEIATDSDDDPYWHAAVLSSLHEKNIADFYSAISDDAATASRYQPAILGMAARMKNDVLIAQLVGRLLDAIDVANPAPEGLDTLSGTLDTIRKQGVTFSDATRARISAIARQAANISADRHANIERRVAAIGLLAACGETTSGMIELVEASQPVDVQIAAAKSLVPRESELLINRFRFLSPTVRSAILDTALARESTSMILIAALKENRIPRHSIGADQCQKLKTHVSKNVKAAAAELFADDSASTEAQTLLRQYRHASASHGNSQTGKQVFVKHCAACHRVNEIGHVVGPDLAALKNRSPKAMLTAILDPNAAVEDKYQSYNVLTVDGVAETGIIAAESSTAIDLQTKEGKNKTILRSEIELIQSTGTSLMPVGMENNVPPSDMNHLLAFLQDLGSPAKQFDGNRPITIQPAEDGTIELAATSSRIYGDQIRFETQYKNVGFWGSPNDRVEWAFVVRTPGKYEVWLDYACPDNIAGNRFNFSCGNETLTGIVQGTGTWDDYQQRRVGTIDLPQATAIGALKGDAEMKNWLFDLRAIRLKRVQ